MVILGAGGKYGGLAVQLDEAGYTLADIAYSPHIPVGGSIATATHGSGLRNGNLATSVRVVGFVAADGTLETLRRDNDGHSFRGVVVGLRAIGVVTHMILDVEPTYSMTQVVYKDSNLN